MTDQTPLTAERSRDLPIERRLWSRGERVESGCLIWTGFKNRDGYGLIRFDGRTTRTHRVAYILTFGPIPDGFEIDHLCRVRDCMEPTHLEAVPHLVNVRRGIAGINSKSRTHCVHGHPFDAKNTTVTQDGRRRCRACSRRTTAESKMRRIAA